MQSNGCLNKVHIAGVMVKVFTSRVKDCGFVPDQFKPKTTNLVFASSQFE